MLPLTSVGKAGGAAPSGRRSKVEAAIHSAVAEDRISPATAARAIPVWMRLDAGPRKGANQRRQPPMRRATSIAPETDRTDDRAPIDDDTADTIPEAPADPITQPGDIWALGHHRLICGDATDPAVVARLMGGAQSSLLFTSPPYAQQRDYGAAKEKVGDWDVLMQGVFAAAPVTADAQLLVNLGLIHRDGEWIPDWEGWLDWMRAQGWRRFGWYVWDQGPGLPGDWNGRLAPSHEFIFHFNRQPRKPNKTVASKHAGETLGGGGLRGADGTVHRKTGFGNAIQSHRIPDSVFRIMRHKGGLGAAGSHPAVFPVALVEAVLEAFSDPGDLVFEPFCGSGTQLIAAERTGRRCCAVELDPAYCDVAVRRWEMATGRKAVQQVG